jgi:hypothetical protein
MFKTICITRLCPPTTKPTSCHVMLRYVVLRYITLRYVMFWATSRHLK